MILNARQMITEDKIKENTIVKEKNEMKEKALEDLDVVFKAGLISKDAYEKAKSKIIKRPQVEEKEVAKENTEISKEKPSEKKEDTKKTNGLKKKESLSIIKKQHIRELEDMKKNWIKDLESLRNLHMHGIISDEEYEKSRLDIEDKISNIENTIKRELEKEELETLKKKIEQEIKEAFQKGIFKEEEEQSRKDLEALESLYKRGLINENEYKKKKEELKQKIENYDKLIELIDAIFNKYIDEISRKVESIKKETIPKKVEKKNIQEKKELKGIYKILNKLGLYDVKEEKDEGNALIKEIEEVYKESEPRFKISNIALVLKKEIKNKLKIEEALTHTELIKKIKESKEFDEKLKSKLISFFERVIVKEYLEDEDEKDIELIYKEAIEIVRLLTLPTKSQKLTQPQNQKIKEEKGELIENESKNKKTNDKKSILDKINEFFGV